MSGDISGHYGSVLCLKFFWENGETEEDETNGVKNGVLFSGSSDCMVCVWDLYTTSKPGLLRRRPSAWGPEQDWRISHGTPTLEDEEEESGVKARVKSVLRGHGGGVLDLRVDAKWIVSW